jgi:hypothetical protein
MHLISNLLANLHTSRGLGASKVLGMWWNVTFFCLHNKIFEFLYALDAITSLYNFIYIGIKHTTIVII